MNKQCLWCNGDVPRESRHANNKKFCSVKCRNKSNWQKYGEAIKETWRAERSKYAEGKIQCRLCDGWFVKPALHVFLQHHLTEQQYKEHFDLPLSKGIIPEDHRLLLRKLALENKMDEQLQIAGVWTRYKKDDPKAKAVTGWKGRNGSRGYREEDL